MFSAKLLANLIEQELVWSRKQEIDEIIHGLDDVGLLDYLKAYSNECKNLLCYNKEDKFGVAEFKACMYHMANLRDDDFAR